MSSGDWYLFSGRMICECGRGVLDKIRMHSLGFQCSFIVKGRSEEVETCQMLEKSAHEKSQRSRGSRG